MQARVFIVDDHPIVRQGLSQLINQSGDLLVCGEAEDAPGAIQGIEAAGPDIAIVDITLKAGNGIDLTRDIRARMPQVRVLILSMHDESLYAERALRAGARGFIMKQEANDRVVMAIRRVLAGEVVVSDAIAGRLLNRFVGSSDANVLDPLASLSDRELQVFQMIGRGMSTRRIAEDLNLSVKTIETYREHIKEKLHLKSGHELVHYAVHRRREGESPL